ncbi:MAG: c-type cytochrome [Bacteroidota bacterium]
MKRLTYFFLSLGLITTFFNCQSDTTKETVEDIQFNLPEGFVLEDLYQPQDAEQGSWVALAKGPSETIFACDQYGSIYQFAVPAKGQKLSKEDIQPLNLEIGNAHGLLWAFNSLYVAVNKRWDDEIPDEEEIASGIYRVQDSNNDGTLDKIEMLLKLEGDGEHGPHNFAVSPDGKSIYFLAGNHVLIPDVVKSNSRLPNNWGEDNLFAPYKDARGHASHIKAPGGWIMKMDPEGQDFELVSAGYRNPFDLAFNQDGELFTYDADMEWDIGMPWYRPTRVCHVTSGSEYGWRTGSGKWPDYYPDNLPAVVNLEQGCPTGILMGNQLNFPSEYQDGIFIMDWSFGTIYYVDLESAGSTYKGSKREFLSGTPLPLTDMIAGADGQLYFATGGRRLSSHLYRLSYQGEQAGEAKLISTDDGESLRTLRKNLERYHNTQSPEAIPLAWENLNHPDRFIAYAARIALEHQPTHQWELNFFRADDTDRIILSGLALARQAPKGIQDKIINKLQTVEWATLSTTQKVNLLRTLNVLCIRTGEPSATNRRALIAKYTDQLPTNDLAIDKELSQLLLFLKDETAVNKIVALLKKHTEEKTLTSKNMLSEEITERSQQYGPLIREVIAKMPPSEAIFYGVLLSHAEVGWNESDRTAYFQWFFDVLSAKGGLSFKPFMENVRLQAMKHVPEADKAKYEKLSGAYSPAEAFDDLPEPIGPGKEYAANELTRLLWKKRAHDPQRIAKGKRAFQAAMCGTCHRLNGEGGGIGPDLSQIHTKFGKYDLFFSIYSPNDEISDQYAFTLFHLKDGSKTAGRILSENDEAFTIMPNPYTTTHTVQVAKADVEKQEWSPISPMPSGLLNRLNEEEVMDLMDYLLVGERE